MSVNQEEDPLSLTEPQKVKTEPEECETYPDPHMTCNMDVKYEIKAEEEEKVDDTGHVNKPIPSVKTVSKLEDEQVFLGMNTQGEEENTDIGEHYKEMCEVIGRNVDMSSVCIHGADKFFQVDVCNKSFPVKSTLTLQTHENTSFNSNSLSVQSQLDQQLLIHTDEISSKFSVKSSEKTDFIANKHAHNNMKLFECCYCEKSFSEITKLKRHTRYHRHEKPFKCNCCEKSFSLKGSLITHTRIHTHEKPFECTYCEKSFSVRSSLTRHTRIHTNEKPFECNYCEKSFSDKSSLIIHTRIHTHEKPFECGYCEKLFPAKSSLVKHTRIHTHEKPFECNYCEKTFSFRGSFTRHSRIHTNETPFKCKSCKKSFSVVSSLMKHTCTVTS